MDSFDFASHLLNHSVQLIKDSSDAVWAQCPRKTCCKTHNLEANMKQKKQENEENIFLKEKENWLRIKLFDFFGHLARGLVLNPKRKQLINEIGEYFLDVCRIFN